MPQNHVELTNIFNSITQSLIENQQTLNQSDEYNQNHGDNMVQTFETITRALQEKQGKTDSSALSYAARKLARTTTSKSGQLYAQNLAQAATRFKGKPVDSRGALQLLQTLIGGGQTPQAGSGSGDVLGTLLGGLTGEQPSQAQPDAAGGDLLGALLGGLAGGQPSQAQSGTQAAGGDVLGTLLGGLVGSQNTGAGLSDGLDLGDLVTAGKAYFQAKQGGGSTMQALVQAFMSVSGMGKSADRSQSTSLVVNSFLQALSSSGSQG